MSKLALMAGVFVSLSAVTAKAEDAYWTWDNVSDGTDVLTASDLLNAENWDSKVVPENSSANVLFRRNASTRALNAWRFVQLSRAATFFHMDGDATFNYDLSRKNTVVLSDYPITTTGGQTFSYIWVYADIIPQSFLDQAFICGSLQVEPMANLSFNLGSVFLLDHYANAAGGTRTNPLTATGGLSISWNSGYMLAPRGSVAPTTSRWQASAGSPFLKPVPATDGVRDLPVGTLVSQGGQEAGFLKRIFPDGSIELSQSQSVDGEVDLTFAPLEVNVYQRNTTFNSKAGGLLLPLVHSSADKFVFELDGITLNSDKTMTLDCPYSGMLPGVIRIHDGSAMSGTVKAKSAHFEFASASSPEKEGLPNAHLVLAEAGDKVTFSVQSGVEASVGDLNALAGTIVKGGPGCLNLSTVNGVTDSTGSLVVEAGELDLAAGLLVSHITVRSGATLRIHGDLAYPAVDLRMDAGARVEGEGLLSVPAAENVQQGSFGAGVKVRVIGGDGEVRDSAPVGTLDAVKATNPAFWVDVRSSAMTVAETIGGTDYISRIDDVRKESDSDDYMYATSASGRLYPSIVRNPERKKTVDGAQVIEPGSVSHLYFPGCNAKVDGTESVNNTYELVWNRGLNSIRAIFTVQCLDANNGGGQILGITKEYADTLALKERSAFLRASIADYSMPMIWPDNFVEDDARLLVRDARCYQNGEASSVLDGYGFLANQVSVGSGGAYKIDWSPITTDIHLAGPVAANCFTYQSGGDSCRNGRKRLCEILIYTRPLSESERLSVEQYLMGKWQNCDVSYSRCDSKGISVNAAGGLNLAPAEGETAYVREVSGAGTLSKYGQGTMVIDGLNDSGAGLNIAEGRVRVRSRRADESLVPSGAYLHVDATKKETMEFASPDESDVRVKNWNSVNATTGERPFQHWMQTVYPVYCENQTQNGLPLVDFGNAVSGTGYEDGKNIPCFRFEDSVNLRTVAIMQDTRKSGGSLASSCSSWGSDGLFRGNWAQNYTANPPITSSTPIFGGGESDDLYKYSIAYRMRLNGEEIDAFTAGYTGGEDILSFVGYRPFHAWTFSIDAGYGYAGGGQMLGEYLLYERGLSQNAVQDLEAYLRKKWKGLDTPGYVPAQAARAHVSDGAVLEVYGGAPLTVGALSGTGRIVGSLSLLEGATLEVVVDSDGSVGALSVEGEVDLSSGGCVSLVGDWVKKLSPGRHVLLSADSILPGEANAWTVVNAPDTRICTVSVQGNSLILECARKGMVMIVR